MLIFRNTTGVHVQRKIGKSCCVGNVKTYKMLIKCVIDITKSSKTT